MYQEENPLQPLAYAELSCPCAFEAAGFGCNVILWIVTPRGIEGPCENSSLGIRLGTRMDRGANPNRPHDRPSFRTRHVDRRGRVARGGDLQLDPSAAVSHIPSSAWIHADVPDQLGVLLQRPARINFTKTRDLG